MNATMNITIKAEEVKYKFVFMDSRLQTIRVEGPGDERRFYTAAPRQHELRLTPTIFGEIALHICKMNPESVAELKENLRGDIEYFKILQKILTKLFDQYKELIIL